MTHPMTQADHDCGNHVYDYGELVEDGRWIGSVDRCGKCGRLWSFAGFQDIREVTGDPRIRVYA